MQCCKASRKNPQHGQKAENSRQHGWTAWAVSKKHSTAPGRVDSISRKEYTASKRVHSIDRKQKTMDSMGGQHGLSAQNGRQQQNKKTAPGRVSACKWKAEKVFYEIY